MKYLDLLKFLPEGGRKIPRPAADMPAKPAELPPETQGRGFAGSAGTAKAGSPDFSPSPKPWRDILPTWPDEWRERWGRRANALEDTGLSWLDAEVQAFDEIQAEMEAGVPLPDDRPAPDTPRPIPAAPPRLPLFMTGPPMDADGHPVSAASHEEARREGERIALAETVATGPQSELYLEEEYLPARLDDDADMGPEEPDLSPGSQSAVVFTWLSKHDTRAMDALSDGVFAWMNDHPLSMWDSLEDGTKLGVRGWLDANADAIVVAVAEMTAAILARRNEERS